MPITRANFCTVVKNFSQGHRRSRANDNDGVDDDNDDDDDDYGRVIHVYLYGKAYFFFSLSCSRCC
jgi:hypothetical protein